jgi:hypothetical protein
MRLFCITHQVTRPSRLHGPELSLAREALRLQESAKGSTLKKAHPPVELTCAAVSFVKGGDFMKAAWYEKQGPAREVLTVGDMPNPDPGPGELRIRIVVSGINPGDIRKRQDDFGYGMPYPRVIPHSDGAVD